MKITFVGSLLIAGGLLAVSLPANAGEWVLQLEPVGESSATQSHIGPQGPMGPMVTDDYTFDWATTGPPIQNQSVAVSQGSAFQESYKGRGNAKVDGSVQVVWVWQAKPGETAAGPVPPMIYFVVGASALSQAANEYNPQNLSVAANRDSAGETGSASVSVGDAEIATQHETGPQNSSWSASGSVLFQKKTNGNNRVSGPNVTITAEAGIKDGRERRVYTGPPGTDYPWAWIPDVLRGYSQANGSAGSALDNRSLTISRGSGGGGKREDDPTLDKSKDEWIEDDGTGHGHSRFSYIERVDTSAGIVDNYVDENIVLSEVFTANAGGTWSSNAVGTWSNPHPQDRQPPQNSVATHVEELPNGGALLNSAGLEGTKRVAPGWYNTPSSGGDVNVTYTLKDSGVEAKAKYVLKLHDEWENSIADTPAQTHVTKQILFPVFRIVGPQTGEWDVTYTGKISANLSANFGGNFKAHDWFNAGGDFKAEADLGIAGSYKASAPSIPLLAGESAIPCISFIVKTDHKLLDHFELGGWDKNAARADGKWPQSADLPVNINDTYADWYKLPTGRPVE